MLDSSQIKEIKEQIKKSVPPQVLKHLPSPAIEQSGIQYTILATPAEIKEANLEIGTIVNLDIPTMIDDIIVTKNGV